MTLISSNTCFIQMTCLCSDKLSEIVNFSKLYRFLFNSIVNNFDGACTSTLLFIRCWIMFWLNLKTVFIFVRHNHGNHLLWFSFACEFEEDFLARSWPETVSFKLGWNDASSAYVMRCFLLIACCTIFFSLN